MTINLVGPGKSAVFKHSPRGESSGSAGASGALAGPAHTRLGPAEAITRPSPWRRHRAPGFKDKAVISDAQQPEGAGRAPCHLTSHYTSAPHGAEPHQGHTARALLRRLALGFAVSFQHRNNQSRVRSFILVERVEILVRSSVLGRKPSAGRKKLTQVLPLCG